ncbi:MAG: BRO family protein [Butyricicoccus sp.]|nr:BRO family protein [Butyricicoccus sp.]
MEIKIFKNPQFGEIRTIEKDGEPWFVARDVASALGYAKTENAIAVHVYECDKTSTLIQGSGSNYKSKAIVINESGLYALIFGSKLPSAKQFKHWVTSEILPSIRKTGGYNADATMQSVVQTLATMQRVLEAQQEINKKLLSQLQTPPTVSDEPEQLAFTEHLPYPPLNQKRGQSKRVGRRPVRWFNIRLYNSLYNAYPKPLRELEKDVGVCGVTLRAWRNGENRPNINNARKLAAVLGVDEEDLFLE